MASVWTQTSNLPTFESLKKDITTEVLIIGGGMAGILTAYMLKQAGIDYVLVEAKRIANGITKDTTAKITSQHGLIYSKIMKEFDTEKAKLYYEANEAAIEQYGKLCGNIDCDFEWTDSYVYAKESSEKLQQEMAALEKIGVYGQWQHNLPIPVDNIGGIKFGRQAKFNPLKFLSDMVKDLNIYENTKVVEIGKHEAVTEKATIRADKIVVATHFPIINKHGSYFLKMYQERSYVIAVSNAKDIEGVYVDEAKSGLSFRSYKDLLLIGGGNHRTGKKGKGWSEIEELIKIYYPKAVKRYKWATQDCMTLDGIPYIGKYSLNTEGLFVATGFNKWGMTSSMVAASILRDLIMDKENPYAEVFSPSRTILRSQLFINMGEAFSNLITVSKKRCPHMGCALKWNREEHSYDCSCHGSRFSENGELIDNPSTDDLKK